MQGKLDIDKAYVMGQEVGDDGKIIKYSNLFDYSSLETLQASLWLPVPKNFKVNKTNSEDGFDLSYYISMLSPYLDATDNDSKAKKLRILADLIIDLYDYKEREGASEIKLKWNEEDEIDAQNIIRQLIIHEGTKISPNLEEAAYKNSISANIRNIVQDLKNMDLAYSPIAMDDLQALAAESEKGALVASMSLMNPLTKYLMQVQNMVGKKVIGITAVGEKVFFNLNYYYNEGIRNGDTKWINNLKFSRTFTRIQGRYSHKKKNTKIETATKTNVANMNFFELDEYRALFISASQIDEQLRKKYGITDYDIENQTEKWTLYKAKLEEKVHNLTYNTLDPELIEIHKSINNIPPIDLMISQLLSAATDNAKELILDKINCGSNLAKFHLYLLMVGFDIKDIVTFMTSPCVSLINNLTETNMMDSYITSLKIDDAIDLVQGIIDPDKFFFGTITSVGEFYERTTVPRSKVVYSELYNRIGGKLESFRKERNLKTNGVESFEDLIQTYIQAKLNGLEIEELSTYAYKLRGVLDYESRKSLARMSDFIERLIYSIDKAKQGYLKQYKVFNKVETDEQNEKAREYVDNSFNLDLQEFKNVHELSNETTTLGGVFLGMNQGLPGSKVDLQSKLRNIKGAITEREKIFNVKLSNLIFYPNQAESTLKTKRNKYDNLIKKLQKNNQLLTNIPDVLDMAVAFGLVENFNIEDWLYNKKLTRDDVVNKQILDRNIDIDKIFNGKEFIYYREAVSDYYNIIKGTWNIFDMMDKIPQFSAIIDLLKTVYVFDKVSSVKSNLSNIIFDKIYEKTNYIDEKQNKAIIKYVDDLLITSFFRERGFSFPIYENMEYLDTAYKSHISQTDRFVDLSNAPGRASFKLVFESIIDKLRKEGKYGDIEIPNFKENAFLQGLRVVYDKYEVPRIALELDMMKINSTPNSQKTFQDYLTGLSQLKDKMINGKSLADWFIIYNLYVNQNQYGSDRLTTVFKNSIINKDSVLEDYFQYIGKFDYAKVDDKLLQDLEFNMEDVLIRMAPTVSRSQETRVTYPYIRVRNTQGEYIIKKYNTTTKQYNEISTFPNKDLQDITSSKVSEEQKSNYQSYQMMPMKNQDFVVSLREGLMSSDIDTILDSLISYSRKGLLDIIKENC